MCMQHRFVYYIGEAINTIKWKQHQAADTKSRNKIVSVKLLLRCTFLLMLITAEKWDGEQKQNVATSVVASTAGTRSATSQSVAASEAVLVL